VPSSPQASEAWAELRGGQEQEAAQGSERIVARFEVSEPPAGLEQLLLASTLLLGQRSLPLCRRGHVEEFQVWPFPEHCYYYSALAGFARAKYLPEPPKLASSHYDFELLLHPCDDRGHDHDHGHYRFRA
jgi:hypothetical protein